MSAPAIPIFDVEDATTPLLSASIVPNETSEETTVVQVIAPSTLPAGYKFQASYNNEIFTVTVPENGVVQGQVMYVTFRRRSSCSCTSSKQSQQQQQILPIAVPVGGEVTPPLIVLTPATPILVDAGNVQQVSYPIATATTSNGTTENENDNGQWDDSCYDCCDYGCCHPSFCMSLFTPRLLLGQIMTRLQLDVCGNTTTRQRTANRTCPTILVLVILFYIWNTYRWKEIVNDYSDNYDNFNDYNFFYSLFHGYPVGNVIDIVFNLFMILYFLYLLIKVRYVTRMKYKILPRKRWCCCCCRSCCINGICEDICCSLLFPFCTISQLARQTGNYDTNKASYCTHNGLSRRQHSSNYHIHGPIQDRYSVTNNNRIIGTYPAQV